MVAVSLRTSHTTYLAMRVKPRKRWRLLPQRSDQRGCFALQCFAVDGKRTLASTAVEDQCGARHRAVEAGHGRHDRVPGGDDDAVWLLVGELHRGVGRQVGRA